MSKGTPSHIARATTRGLAGTVLFLANFAFALQQLARSNRPHELTRAPVVALIALVTLVILVQALRHVLRHLRGPAPAPGQSRPFWAWLAVPPLLMVTLMDLWLLLGSASSIPAVLKG